ncbi:MAG: penicillin-binding protein 1C [Chitinophagales bacterium]|nr:penicillin-binding protein 1C [Chitinophagales bacterium]
MILLPINILSPILHVLLVAPNVNTKPARILKYLLIASAVSVFLFFTLNYLLPLPDKIDYSTIVLDGKGEVIHAFLTKDQKWRMKTELSEISPTLKKSLLYKEDKYFYHHPGVNPVAMARAAVMNTFRLKRTSGASTITMQVARMLEPKRRTYLNKVIEIFRALQLEWKYSKDEILQLYFNLVPYGSNVEGVKSASILFFKKNPDHLSLAEVTALSIIPNRPSSLKLGRNNDVIARERNKWLHRFERDKLFSTKEIADALDEPLDTRRTEAPKAAPHLALKLKKATGSDIIRTHLQMQMQLKLEKMVGDYVSGLRTLNIYNSAVVVLDNRTHNVITYIGSANFNDNTDGGQVNGAAAIRQPGSALKPLLYGLCFDNGLLTPKTILTDVPLNINGYQPENFDSKFNGYVSVEFALENSLNVPAVQSLNNLGTDKMIAKLEECNFRQIKKDEKKLGLSLILGGCGVTLEEMAGLYSAFANGGVYHPLSFTVSEKAKVKGEKENTKGTQILSASANYMVTEILSRLARPDLPTNWEQSSHTPRIAWKTGTSYGKRDAWSIGYNKNYTVAVWVGNFSGVGVPELNGANIATPLLFKIFNTIDYNSSNDWYSMPKECGIRQVCSETGKQPSDFCHNTIMDYYIPLISNSSRCDNMQEVAISANEKISYCKSCLPENGYKKKWYKLVPPQMQSYYDDNRIGYEKIPPHNPDCDKVFVEGAPVIRSPRNGTEYFISKKQPEPLQLSCDVTNDVKTVYWYVNDKFFKQTDARTKLFFTPDEGGTKISCTDDKGRNSNIWIKVRKVSL